MNADIHDVIRFWDRRPCNVQHSLAPIGTLDYSHQVTARKYTVEPHILRFAEFPRWKGRRVLELGCGIGTDTLSFARAGATVVAVDFSSHSIDIARERALCEEQDEQVQFVVGDIETLPYYLAVTPYDLVYAFGVLHHTPNPARAMNRAAQYVAPGGELRVMLYHRWSTKVLSGAVRRGHAEAQVDCPIAFTYSRRQARRLIESSTDLRVVSCTVDHIFPYRVPDYIQHAYETKTWIKWLPTPLFKLLEGVLGWHILITARRDEQ